MDVTNALAWQRDIWRSMGMTEAALDRNFGPGGLPYYRILHEAGQISDEEMEMIETLWDSWEGDRKEILKIVRQILA